MTKPGEHKTVQARILAYAQAIGWSFVPREEAEARRGFDPQVPPAERAKAVQESFEERQTSTAEALAELLREIAGNETRKKEQVQKSFDGLTYFVYRTLLDANIANAEEVSHKIRQAFTDHPNWRRSESAMRDLRQKVTFAIYAETEDLNQVSTLVEELFSLLERANRI
jgi:type I restriction enzyme, R subunit